LLFLLLFLKRTQISLSINHFATSHTADAAIAQAAGLVPIVEPEILMDGTHSAEECAVVTEHVLSVVFYELKAAHVLLEGMILKPNMCVAGNASSGGMADPAVVAALTVQTLRRTVPAAVPGKFNHARFCQSCMLVSIKRSLLSIVFLL
jgi:fructose-bisphosphate aldolase class I